MDLKSFVWIIFEDCPIQNYDYKENSKFYVLYFGRLFTTYKRKKPRLCK